MTITRNDDDVNNDDDDGVLVVVVFFWCLCGTILELGWILFSLSMYILHIPHFYSAKAKGELEQWAADG